MKTTHQPNLCTTQPVRSDVNSENESQIKLFYSSYVKTIKSLIKVQQLLCNSSTEIRTEG